MNLFNRHIMGMAFRFGDQPVNCQCVTSDLFRRMQPVYDRLDVTHVTMHMMVMMVMIVIMVMLVIVVMVVFMFVVMVMMVLVLMMMFMGMDVFTCFFFAADRHFHVRAVNAALYGRFRLNFQAFQT